MPPRWLGLWLLATGLAAAAGSLWLGGRPGAALLGGSPPVAAGSLDGSLTGSMADREADALAGQAIQPPPQPLGGSWTAVANGDRARQLVGDGGRVWAATSGGVVRWPLDGGAYRQYLAPQDGLPDNDVAGLARDNAGNVWAATAKGLARLDAGADRWQAVAGPAELGRRARAVALAPDGGLWVGFGQAWDAAAPGPAGPGAFVGGGLARYAPGTGAWGPVFRAVPEGPLGWVSLPSDEVTALTVAPGGLVWAGTAPFYTWREDGCGSPPCPGAWLKASGGLAAYDPASGRWARWGGSDTDTCAADTVMGLAADEADRVWVATRGDGLQVFREGLATVACGAGHSVYKRSQGGVPLPGTRTWSVAVGPDGRVYVGAGSERGYGVAVLTHHDSFGAADADDTWATIWPDAVAGPSDVLVGALLVRPEGLVAGTLDSRDPSDTDGFGLKVRNAAGAWRTLATGASGLPGNRLAAIEVDPRTGSVWYGTVGRGVARWDGRGWAAWRAWGRAEVGARLALTGTARQGELVLDLAPAEFALAFPGVPAKARLGLDDPVLYELYDARQDPAGTRVTVFPPPDAAYPAGAPLYTVRRGPAGDTVTAIDLAADALWLSARPTLARRANPHFGHDECDEDPGTPAPDCRWDGGLSRFDGSEWTAYEPSVTGLPGRDVQALAVAGRGQVWIGTGGAFGDTGRGAAVLDSASGTWRRFTRASAGEAFGYDNVTAIREDPVTGQFWLASQGKPTCPTPASGPDRCPGLAGAISRFDGTSWRLWARRGTPPAPSLPDIGAFQVLYFDRDAARLWAGGWAGEANFHWNTGSGLHAVVTGCARNCAPDGWQLTEFEREGTVVALAVDGAGRLWAGGHRAGNGLIPPTGGLRLLQGEVWTVHNRRDNPLPSDDVTTLAAAGSTMWVGTRDAGAVAWRSPELAPRAFLPVAWR